jgi:hypothetical protein
MNSAQLLSNNLRAVQVLTAADVRMRAESKTKGTTNFVEEFVVPFERSRGP